MSGHPARRIATTLMLLWVLGAIVGMLLGWIDVTGTRLVVLALATAGGTATWLDSRKAPGTDAAVELCTGGDLCPCYPCTVGALHDSDRAWLAAHGWNGVTRRPVGPKRSTWQTAFDRAMQHEAESLRTRVNQATRVRAGASHHHDRWRHPVFGNRARPAKAKYLR